MHHMYHMGVHIGSSVSPSPAHIERYLQYNVLKIYYLLQFLEGPSGTPGGGLHV